MGPRTVCLRNSVPTHCFLSSSHAEVSSHCLSIDFQLLSCCCSWFKVRFPTWKSGIIIVQQSKDPGLGVYGSSPRGSKVQPRLRIMGGRKGCRLSILALGQSSKALRFGALSPPISQVSMETEARKEEEGGRGSDEAASQSGLEWRREPDLPSGGQGSFLAAAPTSAAAALKWAPPFSVSAAPRSPPPRLCSPLGHFLPVGWGYVASQGLQTLHK